MADFIIKSAAGTGNKTLIQGQDQSGSNYAIQIGDGGASIIKPSSIKTTTNSYDAIKVGELNSLGYLQHMFFGCSYYQSVDLSIPNNTWTEVGGTWAKHNTTGATGSDDADPFGKFGTSTGRWTPTVSGYYMIAAGTYIGYMDDAEVVNIAIRKNGDDAVNMIVGVEISPSTGANHDVTANTAGIVGLDTNDYVSLWVHHNEGSSQDTGENWTKFSAHYVGSSDL